MREAGSDDCQGRPEPMAEGGYDDDVGSRDDDGADQGPTAPAPAVASVTHCHDTKFSIDDDMASEEDVAKSGASDVSEETITSAAAAVASKLERSQGETRKSMDGSAEEAESRAKVVNENISSLPPRLKMGKTIDAKAPMSTNSPPPVKQPESTSVTSEPTPDGDADFGPFVEPVVDSEWNPFGDDENLDESQADNPPFSHVVAEEELDNLRKAIDSEYEMALEDHEISWRAR